MFYSNSKFHAVGGSNESSASSAVVNHFFNDQHTLAGYELEFGC